MVASFASPGERINMVSHLIKDLSWRFVGSFRFVLGKLASR
jgi:hypothetical protein